MRHTKRLIGSVVLGLTMFVSAAVGASAEPEDPAPQQEEKGGILGALGKSLGGLFGSDTPARETTDERLDALTKAIEASPGKPEPYVKRGYEYLFRDDYQDALDDCEEAIRLDADNRAALGLRQRIFVRIDREEDALKDCNRLIDDLGCHDPAVFGSRAAIRLRHGDYDAAAEDLKKAIALNPDDPARDYVAWRKEELSDEMLAHGEEQVRQMLKDRPTMAAHVEESDALWRWAARAFAGEGLPEAVEWSAEPTEWFPVEHRSISPGKRGVIQMEGESDFGEAFSGDRMWAMLILEFHKMRRATIASTQPEVLAIQGNISEEEFVRQFWQFDARACQDLHGFFLNVYLPHAKEKGLDVDPSAWKIDDLWDPLPEVFARYTDEDEYPWYPYASYHRHYMGHEEEPRAPWETVPMASLVHECHRRAFRCQSEEALRVSELILLRDEANADARFFRGFVRYSQRDYGRAVEECDVALAIDPGADHARQIRGVSLVELGRIDEAAAELEKVLKRLPKWPSPKASYAYALAHQGKLDEAMKLCDEALNICPNVPQAYFSRAFVWFKTGRLRENGGRLHKGDRRRIRSPILHSTCGPTRMRSWERRRRRQRIGRRPTGLLVKRLPED